MSGEAKTTIVKTETIRKNDAVFSMTDREHNSEQGFVKVPIEMHLEMTRQFGNEYSIHDMLSYLFIKVRRLDERA